MKYLKGHKKRYFTLAIIARFSSMGRLLAIDTSQQYHHTAYVYSERKTSPPIDGKI